jgi:hypothetical protein
MAMENLSKLSLSELQRRMKPLSGGLEELMYKRPNLGWGNIAELSEGALKELGLVGAYDEAIHPNSEHLASSGMSNRMTRKLRKEHYKRKAILEVRKAKERRTVWERRHPGAGEANWERREKKREERKAAARATRRMMKRGRRSSSSSRSGGSRR